MNILIVASKFPPEYSGPGVRIPRLYDAIKEELGVENIYVFCNGIEQTKNEDYAYNGYEVRRRTAPYKLLGLLPARLKNFLAYLYENIQGYLSLLYYKNKNIDLVHIIGHSGGTAAALAWANKRKIPTVMELVNATAQPIQRFLWREVRPKGRYKIVAISENLKQISLKKGIPEQDIWQRPNPILEEKFFPEFEKKSKFRNEICNFSTTDKILLSIAKFMPRKNQIFLLEVMRYLPEDYKLILAGPLIDKGPLRIRDHKYLNDIRDRTVRWDLKDRVKIIPEYVPSEKFIKASDVYLLPAWDEGLGTPMLEALACGIPVIANGSEAAFRQWVKKGINGFLCDFEPQEWSEKCKKALEIPYSQREEQANRIHSLAGTDKVFRTYVKVISTLTKRNN